MSVVEEPSALPSLWARHATGGRYVIAPHIAALEDVIIRAVARGDGRVIVTMPPRHGKALALDTPVPTPVGWTTMGALRPGDAVFDETGAPCRVVAVTPVWRDRPVYRVRLDSGETIVADEAHEWRVRTCRKRPDVRTIRDTAFVARPRGGRGLMVDRQGPLQLPAQALPVDPWVLGFWLGDGSTSAPVFTVGAQDWTEVRALVTAAGYQPGKPISGGRAFTVHGLRAGLVTTGVLGRKHIPAVYLRAGQAQRLALLQGLVDSDGHVTPSGQVEVTTVHRHLAEQVRELVASLGRKVSILEGRATIDGRDVGPKYRVGFYMEGCARLQRKAERTRDTSKARDHYITAEPAGRADTVCIQVDSPSHMFLVGRSMIPTHNSHYVSEFLPSWILGTLPDWRVILASYEADFAASWGAKVRGHIRDHGRRVFGVRISRDSSARGRWDLAGHQGGMLSAGVGGAVTGRGAHVLIIDDPVKNAEAALSKTKRDKTYEWYRSTVYTRLEPGGTVILMATRWHEDDLIGRVLRESRDALAAGDPDAEEWEVVNLPALAGENDPIGRAPGEALWPDRYSADRLRRIRRAIGPVWFGALYQQEPTTEGAGIFKRSSFRYYRTGGTGPHRWYELDGERILASTCRRFATMDPASSEREAADWTVLAVWAVTPDNRLLLLDVMREQTATGHLRMMAAAHRRWDLTYIGVEAERVGTLIGRMARRQGATIKPLHPDADKVTRAIPAGVRVDAGDVWFPTDQAATFDLAALEDELAVFPNGAHDDQVDALAYAVLEQGAAFGSDYTDDIPADTEDLEVIGRVMGAAQF